MGQGSLWGAVIHVSLAVLALVAVDADALVAALLVGASGAVEARVLTSGTLVEVVTAVLAGPLWRAVAGVRVDVVDALAVVQAEVALAVVDVDLAMSSFEP